jgi:two-component system response regulator HydG
MTSPPSILVIDDDHGSADTLADILDSHGYAVRTGSSGEQAIALARDGAFAAVLMDVRMPGLGGVEALKTIRARTPETSVIMMTAYTRDELLHEAQCAGARAILPKPLDIDRVLAILAEVAPGHRTASP